MQANIVQELNKVLSDTYSTNCYFVSMNTSVDCVGWMQGSFHANIKFKSEKQILDFMTEYRRDGCILSGETMITNGITREFNYTGLLLHGSKLHRKLLKAQLKHIPKEV